jgi:hypothetical protein
MAVLQRVNVIQIRDGEEPSVVLSAQARHDGRAPTMTLHVGVPDAALFERLRREVALGDTLRVSVETSPDARYRSSVLEFEKSSEA